MKGLLIFLLPLAVNAKLEVIRPDYSQRKIVLKIVKAFPDSWDSSTLIHSNSREMSLVCAKNRAYGYNPYAYILYRNYYNEIAGKFRIDDDQVCRELSKFITQVHVAIGDDNPLRIMLNRKAMKVEKIIYPNIDPLNDKGKISDLLPKKEFRKKAVTTPLNFH